MTTIKINNIESTNEYDVSNELANYFKQFDQLPITKSLPKLINTLQTIESHMSSQEQYEIEHLLMTQHTGWNDLKTTLVDLQHHQITVVYKHAINNIIETMVDLSEQSMASQWQSTETLSTDDLQQLLHILLDTGWMYHIDSLNSMVISILNYNTEV